jgi:exopolysaccharide production protein ExoY
MESAVSLIIEETGFDHVRPSWARPGRWLLRIVQSHRMPLKRGLDLGVACLMLLLAAPVLVAAAVAIWVCDGHPVVYSHVRLGRHGRSFGCLKLRTMRRDGDAVLHDLLARSPEARAEWTATRKLKDDPRVLGAVGQFLRRWSLDELPQLWNVLRGEMSLVGPRPIVADELVHYDAQAPWYFAVRPGLTGLWQVGGRSDAGYRTRVALDVQYAKAPSLRADLAILWRTGFAVLACRGAY